MASPKAPATPFENDPELLANALANFNDDAFALQTVGIEIIAAAPNRSFLSMPAGRHLENAKAGVHGGALFTLADLAVAVADFKQGETNVTVDASIQYLNVAQGSVLYAYAYAVRRGQTMGFYRVDVSDDTGVLVATANFTYLHRRLQG